MKCVKKTIASCLHTLRNWSRSYRGWAVCGLISLFTLYQVKPIYQVARHFNCKVSPWILPFVDGSPYMRVLIYLGIVFLFCDAPFPGKDGRYVMIRSGRKPYAAGQILAIGAMSAIYFLSLAIVPVLFHIWETAFSWNWGNLLYSVCTTNLIYEYTGATITYYPKLVEMNPIAAMGMVFLIDTLTGTFLGMIVYFGNVWIEKIQWAGVGCASALVLLDPVLGGEYALYRYSPVSWGQLKYLDFWDATIRYSWKEVSGRLFLGILISGICCLIKMNRAEIREVE